MSSPFVDQLIGVLRKESAQIGVLISMNEPTRPMREAAASAGFYESPWGSRHPKIQLLTVGELLAGKQIDYPAAGQTNVTLRKARRARGTSPRQPNLIDE